MTTEENPPKPKRDLPFVSLSNGKVIVTDFNDVDHEVKNKTEFLRLVVQLARENAGYFGDVLCSSTIHFPKESTDDPKLIAFCHWITAH